jgi:hypothetical protein
MTGLSDKRWNTGMNETKPKLFIAFNKRPQVYVICALGIYMLINNTINATSDWMEATRNDVVPQISLWEPFAWEYTSALSHLILLPLLFWWFAFVPFNLGRLIRFISLNLIATVIFSALHVALMVTFREGIYWLMGTNYNFGDIFTEFFYEYRKDAWGYLFFMLIFYAFRFIHSRLMGEASLISQQNEPKGQLQDNAPEHFLVKKLDKEYLVKVTDIEWLEAAGNYVNLHAGGRIYPLRSVLSKLLPRLASKGFIQIHRSYGVNLNKIESVTSLPSGDGEVLLISGKSLNLSRRYKEAFKNKFK